MDCTQSMTDYIAECKNLATEVIDKLKARYFGLEFRVAFVGYRDFKDKEPFIRVQFTTNVDSVITTIKDVEATGGDDIAEDVVGALAEVAQLNWIMPIKLLAHVTDAPGHNTIGLELHDDSVTDFYVGQAHPKGIVLSKVMDYFQNENIKYVFVKISEDTDKMTGIFKEFLPSSFERHTIGKNYKELLSILFQSSTSAIESSKLV